MLINKIEIEYIGKPDDDGNNMRREILGDRILIFSEENSNGKTTFMRILPWALGHKNYILTPKVKSSSIKTTLEITVRGDTKVVKRIGDEITLIFQGKERVYFIKNDQDYYSFIEDCFKLNHRQYMLAMACMVIDQENGWKVINRGLVYGNSLMINIPNILKEISIENSFKKNKYIENIDLMKKIDNEIKATRKLLNIDVPIPSVTEEKTVDQKKLEIKLNVLNSKIRLINEETEKLSRSIKNSDLIKEILLRNDIVFNDNGVEKKINKDNIKVNSVSNSWINQRKLLLKDNKIIIIKQIADVKTRISEMNQILDVKIDQVKLGSLNFMANNLHLKIDSLLGEKVKLSNELESIYIDPLSINERYNNLIKDDFLKIGVKHELVLSNEKWTRYSGADRRFMVLSTRMALNSIVSEYIGIKLPMFIDSLFGEELDDKHNHLLVKKVENFKNQIIVASIDNNLFDEGKWEKIQVKKKLFNKTDQIALF